MKRLFLIVIVLLMTFCLLGCKVRFDPEPQIREGEFPFVVEYEMNGERYLIEDTVVCTYDGYDWSNNFAVFGYPYRRTWGASLKSGDKSKRLIIEFEPNTESLLVKGRINMESSVILHYGYGGYYLGDPEDCESGPCFRYVEHYKISERESYLNYTPLTNEQLEHIFGIKILKFEFSAPIENTFIERK